MKVLITGATGGLGSVLGQVLLDHGHTVYGTSRKVEGKSAAITLLPLDVTNQASVEACIEEFIRREGRIDVVVNCVNEMIIAAHNEQTLAENASLFETNVLGVMAVCQTALQEFRKQGSGHIINMSSAGGILAIPYMGTYTATKFALEAMTESLYHEVKDERIRVTIMQPSAMYMERGATGHHLRLGERVSEGSFSHQIVKMMASDTESSPLKPEDVAERIAAVIAQTNTPVRVPLARSRVLGKLKRLLPQRAIDGLIQRVLSDAAAL